VYSLVNKYFNYKKSSKKNNIFIYKLFKYLIFTKNAKNKIQRKSISIKQDYKGIKSILKDIFYLIYKKNHITLEIGNI
jgi:hypothetical protein